jgi:hypothetical protein
MDAKISKRIPAKIGEKTIHFVSVHCMLCVGRESYAQNRRTQILSILKDLSPSVGVAALKQGSRMRRDELQRAAPTAAAFGELMAGIHWMGLRELFDEFLPVLMNAVLQQAVSPQLQLSVAPFEMLYYVRQSKPGDTTLATARMLETICLAYAATAEKTGLELLDKVLPNRLAAAQILHEGERKRVIFYAADLFRPGPTVNLVGEAIILFSKLFRAFFDVWVAGEKPVDKNYPPSKDLAEHFEDSGRLILLGSEEACAGDLEKVLEVRPHAMFSFPGWTYGDRAWMLYALAKKEVMIFNLVGFPGPMHFPSAVTATLVGPAVGKEQLMSTTRERFAVFGPGETYQPSESHPHLNAQVNAETRSDWGLPDNFIIFFPGTTNRVDKESAFQYFQLLRDSLDAVMLFLNRPETMESEIMFWLEEFITTTHCDAEIRLRIIFRPFSDGTPLFMGLVDVIVRGGKGGAGISSFGSVVPHTTVQDILRRQLVMFVWKNPNGLMSERVAAEVVEAAGLGVLCVGETVGETLEKLRQYMQRPDWQASASDHLKMMRDRELGVFNPLRTPLAWKAVFDHYLQATRDAGGDRAKLKDFPIPPHIESQAPVMVVNLSGSSAKSVDDITGKLKGTEREMENLTKAFLTEFALQTGALFLRVQGTGSFVNVICCQLPDGRRGALKLSKASRPKDRLHNDPNMREAALLLMAHDKFRKSAVKPFPEPYYVLENNTSFAGITAADKRGHVLSFLFCEFVEKDLTSTFAHHTKAFQETGTFEDSLRLKLFCPFLLALHHAHANGFYIMDIKPDNARIREDGSVAFTDLNLGHMFHSVVGRGRRTAQVVPSLLTRRNTTLLAQEHAAAGRQRKVLPKGPFPSPRARPGSQLVSIARAMLRMFWQKASIRGLADLGGGARAFQDPRNTQSKSAFNREWASDADLYAAFYTLLLLLTRKKGESFSAWQQRANEALQAGAPGIKKLFLDSMDSGVSLQQELALAKMVDLFASALGPDKRLTEKCLLTHEMNTTAILPPKYDQILCGGGSIRVGGGFVRDSFDCPIPGVRDQRIKLLAITLQGTMGLGACAEEDLEIGDVLGFYVGKYVPQSVQGEGYTNGIHPSRYHVSMQGDIPLGKALGINKLCCDAQPDLVYDFEWTLINNVTGPIFNAGRVRKGSAAQTLADGAGSTGSDDAGNEVTDDGNVGGAAASDDEKDLKANCRLDRVRVWGYPRLRKGPVPELLCMLMLCTHPVKRGEYVMWPYDPDAGPGWSLARCYRD